jgi:enolase
MSATKISAVSGRRVWDSRGNPTVEATVVLENGVCGRAIAPAGASRGSREAVDLRDGGPRLKGLDVQQALANIAGPIAAVMVGREVGDQAGIDAALVAADGTPLKSNLGGNAMVAVSLACLHAAAAAARLPLWQHLAQSHSRSPSIPLPEIQIFGGGAHAGRRVDVQDFMVMVPGATSFDEALEITAEIYHAAGAIMARKGLSAGVADEGGWWPAFTSNEAALETLCEAIISTGETPGKRVVLSLDIAASEFGRAGKYRLALEKRELTSDQMIDMLGRWIDTYSIASIEDPLAEDDPGGMAGFTRAYGNCVQIIGDDYLVTNAGLVRDAALAGACNAALIKVNQAGTVSESVAALMAAEAAGYRSIVSARSGETEDVSISHLAIGLNAGQLKVGSFARSERLAKWNECLRIEAELGTGSFVAGAPLEATWWGQQSKGTLL